MTKGKQLRIAALLGLLAVVAGAVGYLMATRPDVALPPFAGPAEEAEAESPRPTAPEPPSPVRPRRSEGVADELSLEALEVLSSITETSSLSIRVLEASGRPIRDARVAALAVTNANPDLPVAGEELAGGATDSEGRATLGGFVRLGELYLLAVSHPDYAAATVGPLDPLAPSGMTREVVLHGGGGLRGTVKDAHGRAVPARVTVHDLDLPQGMSAGRVEAEVVVDGEGGFLVEHLRLGQKLVMVRSEGFVTALRSPVALRGSQRIEGLDFVMTPSRPITGRVLDARTDDGVAGITVTARPIRLNAADPRRERRPGGPPDATTAQGDEAVTGPDGRFVIEGVGDGLHVVSVPDALPGPRGSLNVNGGAEDVTLRVRVKGALSGRVVDAGTGEPITRFTVALAKGIRPLQSPWTGKQRGEHPEGAFSLRGLEPGRFFVWADAPGYAPATAGPFQTNDGGRVQGVVLRLQPGSVVNGRVRSHDGVPIAGARVSLIECMRDGHGLGSTGRQGRVARRVGRTFPDGSYVLPGVGPGRFLIRVEHEDHAPASTEFFQVTSSAPHGVPDVFMSRAASITGVVLDARGNPDDLATVTATPVGMRLEKPIRPASTDPSGRFVLGGLPAGSYRIRVIQRRGVLVLGESGRHTGHAVTLGAESRRRSNSASSRRLMVSGNNSVPIILTGLLLLVALGGGFWLFLARDESTLRESVGPGTASPGEPTVSKPPRGVASGETPAIQTPAIQTREFDPTVRPATIDAMGGAPVVEGRILASDGTPIAGAEVALIQDVSTVKARPQEGAVRASLVTGPGGRYRFPLTGGEFFLVKAMHPEYTTARHHPVDPEKAETLKADIRLEGGVSIVGSVTDASGLPVAGADVIVCDMRIATLAPLGSEERRGRSGQDGRFEVAHITTGMKRIVVRKEGFSSDGRDAYDLRDQEGLSTELNFVLNRGFSIRGTVIDRATREPVAGATVTGRPVSYLARQVAIPDPRGDLPGAGPPTRVVPPQGIGSRASPRVPLRKGSIVQKSFLMEVATTDDRGFFELHGLMEARYMIQARADGYQYTPGRPADAGADQVEVLLAASPKISGTVVDAETGAPVTAFVIASSQTPDPAYVPVQTRKPFPRADGGRFVYSVARPGQWYLLAEASGYAGGRSDRITVGLEGDVPDVLIQLVRGAVVKGTIVDRDGNPVKDARVSLHAAGPDASPPNPFTEVLKKTMRTRSTHSATTSATGEWSIPRVLGGEYQAHVEHADFADGKSKVFHCDDQGEVVSPPVVLARGAVLTGVVTKSDGSPDAKATIMIRDADPKTWFSQSVQTDAEGRFIMKGLKPGTYKVVVTQRDGVFDLVSILQQGNGAAQTVTVDDGQIREIQLK